MKQPRLSFGDVRQGRRDLKGEPDGMARTISYGLIECSPRRTDIDGDDDAEYFELCRDTFEVPASYRLDK